jgi:glycosyltransferase involved in cell wall biosynthesis
MIPVVTPLSPAAGLRPVARGDDGRGIFLSICVPTYNRAEWLARCFDQLAEMVAKSEFRNRLEVVVSDNHSTDDTPAVVTAALEALSALCPVRAYTQPVNVGAEPNFKFLYDVARGEYVWLCADDDELSGDEFEQMLHDLVEYRPEVCMSTFTNPSSTQNQIHLAGGAAVEMVTDLEAALLRFYRHTMVTQYVLRKRELTPEEMAISEKASHQIVWFCAAAMLLFSRYEQRLLLRSGELARDTRVDAKIRVSPSVFGLIRDSVLTGLGDHPERARFERLLPVITPETYLVGHLLRTSLGDRIADMEIALEDYKYLRANLRRVAFSSLRNFVKVPVVLALFPVTYWLNRRR